MTVLQAFLRGGGTLTQLGERYYVKTARHRRYPDLVLLKYDQINSPMVEPIVRECRGIILDEGDGWRCVARGYDKFFNFGEPGAAEIEWSSARVQEKVDGSLCLLYHYGDQWQVATTGSADASGLVHGHDFDFATLFWQAFHQYQSADRIPAEARPWSFLFELTSPYNRVVVSHGETRLTLIGLRRAETGQWGTTEQALLYIPHVPTVREFPLTSFAQILATFDEMKPLEQEGYVVVDNAHNRVKVKHPGYVALHQAKDGMSARALVEILRRGETSEVLVAFPEFQQELQALRAIYDELTAEIDGDYARLRDIELQKEFAQAALKTRCSAALFRIRLGACRNAREFLAAANLPLVLRLMGLKEETASVREEAI